MLTEAGARRTYYVVQGFTRMRDGVRMDAPIEVRTEAAALKLAERIAPRKSSVMVLSRTGDPTTGEFDEPVVVQSLGEAADDDVPF